MKTLDDLKKEILEAQGLSLTDALYLGPRPTHWMPLPKPPKGEQNG